MDAELTRQLKARQVRGLKAALVSALLGRGDVEESLDILVALEINLPEKLQALDLTKILGLNCQTAEDIRSLVAALKSLGSFGRRLCASGSESIPDTERVLSKATSSLWKALAALKRPDSLLTPLGYTLTPTAMRVPDDAVVAMTMVAGVTADVLVAGEELDRFLSGSHPEVGRVEATFSRTLRAAIEAENNEYQNLDFANQPPATKQPPVPSPRQKAKPVLARKPSLDARSSTDAGSATSSRMPNLSTSDQVTGYQSGGCDLCGKEATQWCQECEGNRDNKRFCVGCDQSWHNHVKRRSHQRVGESGNRTQPGTKTSPTPPGTKTSPIHPPPGILRSKPDTQRQASNRGSMVVVPGKRTTPVYELERKVFDEPTQPEAVYSVANKPRSHPPLSAQHNLLESPNTVTNEGQGKGKMVPDFSEILSKAQKDSSDSDSDLGDTYENITLQREVRGSVLGSGEIQASVIDISADLGAESDLNRRKVKVDTKLGEIEQRLGSIASGLEAVRVVDRINLLREQEFLHTYRLDLDRQISHKVSGELGKSPVQSCRVSAQDCIKVAQNSVNATLPKQDTTYTYSTELPATPQGATYPWRQLPAVGKSSEIKRASGTKNDLRYEESGPRKSAAYEDIEDADIPTVVQTFPRRGGAAKDPVRKAASEPGSGWLSAWECTHCTLHNPQGTRVCAVCSKTTDSPRLLPDPTSSLTRPLPSLPPDAAPPALVGKSPETCTLLRRLVALQRRHGSGVDAALTDSELLGRLDAAFLSLASGVSYPGVSSPDDKLKKSSAQQVEATSRQLLYQLKEAERAGFSCEEFELAMLLGESRPLQWLQGEWGVHVDRVVSMATRDLCGLHRRAKLSRGEARRALVDSGGDVDTAAREAASSWRAAYQQFVANLDGAASACQRDDVAAALTRCEGDLSAASVDLFRRWRASAVLRRVWATEGEVYGNDEVALTLPGRLIRDKPYQQIADKSLDLERRLRLLMAEFDLDSREKAHNVVRLWDRRDRLPDSASIADVIEAVKNCGTTTGALSYLSQQCAVCEDKFPAGKIQLLSFCQCKLCVGCLTKYFSLRIKENQVRDLVCPICRKPDIENREQFEQHIQLLSLMLKHHLSLEVVDLFEKKLRDWNLIQDPNFRWCSYDDCGCGFVFARHYPGELRMDCPECQRPTCYHCKQPWESEHDSRTCEQFEAWKRSNSPDFQLQGLAGLLHDSSIDCPRCRSRYAVSRGGCLHFTCSQCGHEFCSGCYKPFYRGAGCPAKLLTCARTGLHSHHPRNCLYYLGSEAVERLQQLLQVENVGYETAPPGGDSERQTCGVLVQRDVGTEGACAKNVTANHAGLCELHYKEYLVGLINERNIDPLPLLNLDELKTQFSRVGRDVPPQSNGEKLNAYKQRLRTVIQQQIPLPRFEKRPSVVNSNTSTTT